MGTLSRGGSLGSSAHSMGHPGMMGHHPGMGHPGAHRGGHPGFMPGMHPYQMGMMCADANGMMMGPQSGLYGMPPGMGGPGVMGQMGEHHPASSASNPPRRKSTVPVINPELIEASKGPFRQLPKPLALALDEDKDWLTPLHCFVRKNCVEVFTATDSDVQTPSKGKRKPIQVGQIGIRCPHCHEGRMDTDPNRERGSVYYPTSLSSIYNATMNLLQRHLHSCPKVPPEVMAKYTELKKDDARSGTSKKYWIESAKSLGFVDTLQGIKLSAKKAPPPPSTSVSQRMTQEARGRTESEGEKKIKDEKDTDVKKEKKDGEEEDKDGEENDKEKKEGDKDDEREEKKKDEPPAEAPPLVIPADTNTATAFSYLLLSQMQPCVFTEADRLGKRKGLPTGFAGLACRHCFGGYGSGRFFPSSIKTLSDTSKTLNVLHNHMSRCRKVPKEVLEELEKARATHDDERAKMKFGSQKAFFAKIWSRLHDNRPDGAVIKPPPRKPQSNNNGGLRRLSSSNSAAQVAMRGYPGAHPGMGGMGAMGMGGMGMNGMMMGGMGMGGGMPPNMAMMQHPMMMGGAAGYDPQMMAQMGGAGGMYPMGAMGGMPPQMSAMGGARGMMPGMHGSMHGSSHGMDGSSHSLGGMPQLPPGADGKRSLDMLSSQADEMRKRMRHTDV